MDELIHQFLLQSGYPRASVITDVTSVIGSLNGTQPNFIIVDPESADRLAVIMVVDAVSIDVLREYATLTGNVADRLGGKSVQGFVIRVDVDGSNEAEQVQFFRVWPNTALQQLSARTFPDVDSLRVSQKIARQAHSAAVQPPGASIDDAVQASMGLGAYIPGILLALVAVIDWAASLVLGTSMLDTPHSLLLVGAAILLSLPAMLRFQRHSNRMQ